MKPGDAEEALREGAKKVQDATFDEVLDGAERIEERAERGPLAAAVDDVRTLLALVRAYKNREYREIPTYSIAAAVAALAYVLSPIDLIPDFLPGVGLVDDAAVVAVCVASLREDLARFRAWKKRAPRIPPKP